MNQREMFEQSFKRPSDFFKLPQERQWEIDKVLGILDWEGNDLSDADLLRFKQHYRKSKK